VAGAAPLALPNGLQVWARAEMRAPDGRRGLVAMAGRPAAAPEPLAVATPEAAPEAPAEAGDTPASKRLRESDLDLIRTTLQACGGNVSDAAKQLGVSRGLIYRRLRAVRDRA
jgi:transcriptional regulator of acetoin/glycerol metabolism